MPPFTAHRYILLLMTILVCLGELHSQVRARPIEKPKNVILMIGDGMGLSQITAAYYDNDMDLALTRFPIVGFHKTTASNNLVTDSAAGATAFACGVKTYNSSIGMDQDTLPCRSIVQELKELGYAAGIVVTSTITHATPAAFFANVPLRIMYEDIALQLLERDVDFIVGGGKKYFSERKDGQDLLSDFVRKNYMVSDYQQTALSRLPVNPFKNFLYFTASQQPLPASAGRNYLPYASDKAAKFLESHSDQGFFLLIEGSQIDWGGHGNDYNMMLTELLDFDKAVALMLKYAMESENTLLVVTADHETGGLSLNSGKKPGKLEPTFTTNGHTGTMVPVFAYGPSAELFSGIYDNTAIYFKIKKALGLLADTEETATGFD